MAWLHREQYDLDLTLVKVNWKQTSPGIVLYPLVAIKPTVANFLDDDDDDDYEQLEQ